MLILIRGEDGAICDMRGGCLYVQRDVEDDGDEYDEFNSIMFRSPSTWRTFLHGEPDRILHAVLDEIWKYIAESAAIGRQACIVDLSVYLEATKQKYKED